MPESSSRPRDFDSYLEAQAHNLAELRRLPEFAFVERIMALYDRSFALRARDPDVRALQLFIVCHGALLSAAATIGRALPGDTIALTRRAIEAASLAAAIKADPANYERWIDEATRLTRWEERNKGRRPKEQAGRDVVYPPSADKLRTHLGILSDAGVHLTPEFISTQRYRIEPIEGTPGGYLRIIYFETEQRELERALMILASIHVEILEAFDGVFDGVFHRDAEWMRQREEIVRFGKPLAERFRAEAEAKGEEEHGKEFEAEPQGPAITLAEMSAGMGRVLTELHWLRAERAVLEKLEAKDHVGLDFFKVVHIGIIDDYRVRLGRILDTDARAFTIRTIHNWSPVDVTTWARLDVAEALSKSGLRMRQINNLAKRFEPLRSKIYAHNDLRGVIGREELFRAAAIRVAEVNSITDGIEQALRQVYRKWFLEEPPRGEEYSGDDIDEIHRRYMAWLYPARAEQ